VGQDFIVVGVFLSFRLGVDLKKNQMTKPTRAVGKNNLRDLQKKNAENERAQKNNFKMISREKSLPPPSGRLRPILLPRCCK
jgi:hypothetical protein